MLRIKIFLLVILFSVFRFVGIAQQKKAASKKPVSVFLNEYRAGLMSTPKADTNWFIVERKKEIEQILKDILPVKWYKEKGGEQAILAQKIALANPFFTRYL
ncbi:MAG: hypothetical protein Q7U17_01245, partial [Sediminibacterium sp.]|nr:hypothetical protein [Sediminibacterium sp.]